jgi:hypothetical protein
MVLSITSAGQELALQEQGETIRGLEQTVDAGRSAFEMEWKQVEGKPLFDSCFAGFPLEGSHPFSDFFLVLVTPGLRTALGHAAERAEALQTSYNSSEQELQELRNAALETCRAVEEGEAQAGSSLASRLRALGGHITERMRRALHLGVQKALERYGPTTRSTSRRWRRATSSPRVSRTRWRWSAWTRSPPTPPGRSLKPSSSSSSRMLLTPPLLPPEDSWALGPFLFVYQYSGHAALVNKQIVLAVNICQCEVMSYVYCAFLFLLLPE